MGAGRENHLVSALSSRSLCFIAKLSMLDFTLLQDDLPEKREMCPHVNHGWGLSSQQAT